MATVENTVYVYEIYRMIVADDRDELYFQNAKRYKNIVEEKIDWHKRIYFSAGLLLSDVPRKYRCNLKKRKKKNRSTKLDILYKKERYQLTYINNEK